MTERPRDEQSTAPTQYGDGRIGRHEFIRLANQFAYCRGHGKLFHGRLLVVNCTPSPDRTRRAGLIAGKKVHLRAVKRNRARRLLREAFRLTRDRIRADVWLVLIARRNILTARTQDVQRELLQLLHRAGGLRVGAA